MQYSQDFLDKLFKYPQRETFAKIITLNFEEHPQEEIQGRTQEGSTLNIDGQSSLRRSCSLTLVAEELNIHEYYWGLHTKFKLFLGLRNNIDSNYPDICWFPMGIFLITKFNTTQGTDKYTVQIQGKDKMALLNGDIGGTITAISVDFGSIDYVNDDGTVENKKLELKEVIREAVHEYAKEPFHNIIINDMDDLAVELLKYRGENPMYMYIDEDQTVKNVELNGSTMVETIDGTILPLDSPDDIIYDPRISLNVATKEPTVFVREEEGQQKKFTVAKVEPGESVGYRPTELVFAGDLISQAGSTVVAMLDKVKKMLGAYEYFYNLDGQFVWQRKRIYQTQSWLPQVVDKANDDIYIENAAYASIDIYSFEDSQLITQFQNNPDFANIKNDYTVWGKRKSINGAEIPIHTRYAIDKKPYEYTTIAVSQKEADAYARQFDFDPIPAQESKRYDAANYDWREIIYQMALDYRRWNHLDGFAAKVALANVPTAQSHPLFQGYYLGNTGYELYYTDLEGFWRTIYNPGAINGEVVYERQYVSEYQFKRAKQENIGEKKYYYKANCSWGELYDDNTEYLYNGGVDIPTGLIFPPTSEIKILRTVQKTDIYSDTTTYYRKISTSGGAEFIPVSLTQEMIANLKPSQKYYYFEPAANQPFSFSLVYYDTNLKIVDGEALGLAATGENGNPDTEIGTVRNQKTITYPSETEKILYVDGNTVFSDEITYYSVDTNQAVQKADMEDYLATKKIPYYYFEQCQDGAVYSSSNKYFYRNLDGEYIRQEYIFTGVDAEGVSQFNEEGAAIDKPSRYYVIAQCTQTSVYDSTVNYYVEFTYENFNEDGFTKDIVESPESLVFWFDFLDTDGELAKYSVPRIGSRAKVENNDAVKAIYYREIPNVIFMNAEDKEQVAYEKKYRTGYTYILLKDEWMSLFSISSQGRSTMDILDNLLYTHANCAEQIQISALPVYTLQPNTRIRLYDQNSNINGSYNTLKLTIPLNYTGTMTITAAKAIDNIF